LLPRQLQQRISAHRLTTGNANDIGVAREVDDVVRDAAVGQKDIIGIIITCGVVEGEVVRLGARECELIIVEVAGVDLVRRDRCRGRLLRRRLRGSVKARRRRAAGPFDGDVERRLA